MRNPRCGGGGAYRLWTIHTLLASRHQIAFFGGKYPGAHSEIEPGISKKFLGLSSPYILSRISYTIIATIHGIFSSADLIIIDYSVFSPVLSFLVNRNKTIIEFYHIVGKEAFGKYGMAGIFPWGFESAALRCGKNFITLTDSMADVLQTKYNHTAVCASYTGYDTAIDNRDLNDGSYILFFGRIDIRMKGIDILIDAFDKIAFDFPHRLKIAGRGADASIAWLNKRIKTSTFGNRIDFFQNVASKEKYALFHGATFVCMPSRFEGWCISAIEAAASSKATLGTRIPGLKDSIREGITGLLVEPNNAGELALGMQTLLKDRDLRNRLGSAGNVWSKNFRWEVVAQKQEQFYEQIFKELKQNKG